MVFLNCKRKFPSLKSQKTKQKHQEVKRSGLKISTSSSSFQSTITKTVPSLDYSPSSSSSEFSTRTSQELPRIDTFEFGDDTIMPFQDQDYASEQKKTPKVPFGWEARFDPVLHEFYYLNQINNLIQLDHPDEVLSPISRHASHDSVFQAAGANPNDDLNHKLSRFGDASINSEYRERALNTHFLLANGTGIPKMAAEKRDRAAYTETSDFVSHGDEDDDLSSIASTISVESLDRTAENIFYHGYRAAQPTANYRADGYFSDDDEDREDVNDDDDEELATIRRRMLMEVKCSEMQKLTTV